MKQEGLWINWNYEIILQSGNLLLNLINNKEQGENEDHST